MKPSVSKVVDAMINSLIYQKDGCNTIGELVQGVMWTMTDCGPEQKFDTQFPVIMPHFTYQHGRK